MTPDQLKKQTATWKKRRPRLHSLDDTDDQIAPGKDMDDWMSLSAIEMDRAKARSKGDELVAALAKKKRFKR